MKVASSKTGILSTSADLHKFAKLRESFPREGGVGKDTEVLNDLNPKKH
jgi:hypothetical protein